MLFANSFWTTDNPEVNRSKADFPLRILSWRETILELEPAERTFVGFPYAAWWPPPQPHCGSTSVHVRCS
jgi:hypothetical protein